jgi:nucleotide-binding universal stress UspA family protein
VTTASAPAGSPDSAESAADPPIVVGVDGSPAATAALRWAAAEARSHGRPLRVVYAFAPPSGYGYPMPMPDLDDALLEGGEACLDEVLAAVFGDKRPAEVQRTVVEGSPAQVLIDVSAKSSLLVLGARGHGTFLFGSVSDRCVHHASCPVVIVRD